MILAADSCLKIVDFKGCGIDSNRADSLYKWFSYHRSTPKMSSQTDIFASSCVIYEIITGRVPYLEFENSDDLVEQLYAENCFPKVKNIPLGELMEGCWRCKFNSMSEVLYALEESQIECPTMERARSSKPALVKMVSNI